MPTPSIFDHEDLPAYLRAWIDASKLSFGGLAMRVGISRGHCANVVNGKRPLGSEVAADWARALQLDEEEGHYLWLLAEAQAARTERQVRDAEARVRAFRGMRLAARIDAAKQRLYESWLVMSVMELSTWPTYEPSVDWVRSKLKFEADDASIEEAIASVATLAVEMPPELAGLVSTGFDQAPQAGFGVHARALDMAAHALQTQQPGERYFQLYNGAVSEETYAALLGEVRDAFARLIERAESTTEPRTRVVQFGVQLFKVAED